METQNESRTAQPLYPLQPIAASQARGTLLYAYGRMFAQAADGRWHVVDDADGGTDD